MGTKGDQTRSRLVAAMLDLIQRRGYAGTGLSALTEAAGAPKGSLYFHFPDGKEEVGSEAVDSAAALFSAMISEIGSTADGPGEAIRTMGDSLCALLESGSFELGCPVSVVTLEMGSDSPRLRDRCNAAYTEWIGRMTDVLTDHGCDPQTAQSLATTVVSTTEGAMILARARRDVEPLRTAIAVVADLADSGIR
ncbi:MAG: TetR/AcrR family transcriptional regulator [Gordonia sp. (in: high G+C Gram-positive bacteria)]|uniref:TetR/AcrR family transcriptional regulator n=1 Tax=Gordonia sp. (in: high G+C Gram-positive bacteria) TaxID=84139 RepID=UPI0039E4D7F9